MCKLKPLNTAAPSARRVPGTCLSPWGRCQYIGAQGTSTRLTRRTSGDWHFGRDSRITGGSVLPMTSAVWKTRTVVLCDRYVPADHSFIFADDFADAKALADFLLKVGNGQRTSF